MDLDHLQPDFDPSSVKIANLRNILNLHNIEYPSSAKKTDLIEIYNDKILPNRSKLLNEYTNKIKNSNDKSFINATSDDNDDDEDISIIGERTITDSAKKGKINGSKSEKRGTPEVKTENAKVRKNTPIKTKKPAKTVKAENVESESKLKKENITKDVPSEVENSEAEEGSFTKDNVFQSKHVEDDKKSKTTKKRKHVDDTPNSSSAKKIKFPTVPPSTSKKTPKKSIFDDSDSDIFEYSIVNKTPSKSTTTSKATPSKDSKKSPVQSPVEKERTFQSIDEEVDNFDKQLNKIKTKNEPKSSTSTPNRSRIQSPRQQHHSPPQQQQQQTYPSVPLVDNALAQSLGITIQGFQPPVIENYAPLPQVQQQQSTPAPTFEQPQQFHPQTSNLNNILNDEDQIQTSNTPIEEQIVQETPKTEKTIKATPQKSSTPKSAKKLEFDKLRKPTSSKSNTPTGKKSTTVSSTPKSSKSTARKTPTSTASTSKRTVTPLSSKSIPKRLRTPLTKASLTPKPRLISITSSKFDSEDEEGENDEEEENEVVYLDRTDFKPEEKSIDDTFDEDESTVIQDHHYTKQPPLKISQILLTFLTWLFIVGSGIFGYWYYEQRFLVGYCGQEIDQITFGDTKYSILDKLGDFLDTYCKPKCIPSPSNSRCFKNLEIGCFEDFMEYKPWYDIILPGNKRCIPDTKKAEKLEIMIDVALDLIRSKNAAVSCGKSTNDFESGISLEDLHDLLLSMKANYITIEEFEELWKRSIIELEKEPDIIVRQFEPTSISTSDEKYSNINNTESSTSKKVNKIFRSTSLQNISLKCQLQNSIWQNFILYYKFKILLLIFVIILLKIAQFKYKKYQLNKIKIDIIYQEVISKLQNQIKLNQKNPQINPYIGSNQLRDLILSNELNLTKRLEIWQQVINKIEINFNILCKIVEEHGEIIKVWQWIGSSN
ncbi:uncharacterized protein KGF55_001615 [Candida pseudojiufengensis]|uniref:uncharacterized protein n=1 Tax=Candida pseudojiufengensis TaxID=497109 RepID=UPI0022256A92|nr:uncharacterized protein KGF55_001615 [Candida pseudojiufengensis]KAI5965394.1 hypothetical protein KGF55_001615 [Candida pseudojiufengensis]